MSDLRFALRRLRMSLVFTTFAVVTLALGIGATTAVYSMVRFVLAPPRGVANLDRVVNLSPAERGRPLFSLPEYEEFRARQKTFERVTAWRDFSAPIAANGQAMTSYGETVSGDYFHVLGVTLARGRLLQPADDRVGAPRVAVLSDIGWQRLFARDEQAVGRDIKIGGERFEIVGVAPPAFRGLQLNGLTMGSVWVPLAHSPRSASPESRWLFIRGLLPPGRSVDDVAAEVAGIGRQLEKASRVRRGEERWQVKLLADAHMAENDAWLVNGLVVAVMTAVVVVLLVACSNLANLMLARGSERHAEFAVRLALGASRARLVRATLIDSVLIALAGGLAGLAVARVIVVSIYGELALVGTAASILFEPRLDAAAFAVAAAASILTLVIIGLMPALQSTRPEVRSALASAGPGAILRWRGRRVLITLQVMASVLLLSLAALAHSQLREVVTTDSGIDLDRLAIASVNFRAQKYDDSRATQLGNAIVAALRRYPDVADASMSTGLPIGEGVSAQAGRLRLSATRVLPR